MCTPALVPVSLGFVSASGPVNTVVEYPLRRTGSFCGVGIAGQRRCGISARRNKLRGNKMAVESWMGAAWSALRMGMSGWPRMALGKNVTISSRVFHTDSALMHRFGAYPRAIHSSAVIMRAEKAYLVDDRLAKLVKMDSRVKTRTDVIKAISAYVKEKHLQLENNKRMFKCNKELEALLGKSEMAFIGINGCISNLLHDIEEKGSPEQKEEAAKLIEQKKAEKALVEAEKAKKGAKRSINPEILEKAKEAKTGIYKEYVLSAELKAVCGESFMARPNVIKKLWTYAKEKKLVNGRKIKPDAKLAKIVGTEQEFDGIKMTGMIGNHLKAKN